MTNPASPERDALEQHEQKDKDLARVDRDAQSPQPLTAASVLPASLHEGLVDGKAGHWGQVGVFSETVECAVFQESVEVSVTTEEPRNDAGQRVVRRGNRWYPTMVDVEISHGDVDMFPAEARKLAAALIAAADVAEACDREDTDPCGHWSPCQCRERDADAWLRFRVSEHE